MVAPRTLLEAVRYFSDRTRCNEFMIAVRWTDGKVRCPRCGSDHVTYMASVDRFKCYGKHARAKFSLKVGTIFEDSAVGLEKWLPALWLLTNCKNGISSYELHRAIGVTQKTAWFMLHRIRLAMQDETGGKLSGHVEVDESFIGGKARNMHKAKRERVIKGTGGMGKVAVMGLLSRHGKNGHSTVRLSVVGSIRAQTKSILPSFSYGSPFGSSTWTLAFAAKCGASSSATRTAASRSC